MSKADVVSLLKLRPLGALTQFAKCALCSTLHIFVVPFEQDMHSMMRSHAMQLASVLWCIPAWQLQVADLEKLFAVKNCGPIMSPP